MTELEQVSLGLDELEALRLCDLEGLDQEEAGTRMQVSRGTVYRLLQSGRQKVISAITRSQALIVMKPKSKEPL